MITVVLEEGEAFNEETNEFIYLPKITLQLEHSLLSVHKWEAKTHKPFFGKGRSEKTREESLEYIRCMTIKPSGLPLSTYLRLTQNQIKSIFDYIDDPMTATVISKLPGSSNINNGTFVTAEIIYWQMIELGIPLEFEKRHINQLTTLIEVIARKNGGKKMNPRDAAMRRNMLNEQRKAKYHTRG